MEDERPRASTGSSVLPGDVMETARLRLRRFTEADVEVALAIHANPDLARFVPSAVLKTPRDATRWLHRVHLADAPGRGWWCIEAGELAVGAILLKAIPPSAGHDAHDIEIGWRAAEAATGRGYVTEAARAVLEAALAGGLERVVAVIDPENRPSRRVAERIGMHHRGRTQAYYDASLDLFVAQSQG